MTTDQIDAWNTPEEPFGFSPRFHDAEVVSVDLRREPEPSIIRVHAWRTNSDADATLLSDRLTHHCQFRDQRDLRDAARRPEPSKRAL